MNARAASQVGTNPVTPKGSLVAALILATCGAVFWLTAYPSITWWDSSQYSLAAATLGITGPPGSLLLTLLGWPMSKIPIAASPAFRLNLFAGALAAATVAMVFLISLRLLQHTSDNEQRAVAGRRVLVGAAFGALTLAFSATLWEHATKFSPYILTAVFTTLILWTLLRWWENATQPDAWRWLALMGLLFGLDFSVHRTNALLLPGALIWILIRNPGTLIQLRKVVSGAAGLLIGLSLQLLLIPLAAATNSPLNSGIPTTFGKLWSYISLEQLGGGFLLGVFPRKSELWSNQFADLLHALRDNFLDWSGPLGPIGALPAVLVLLGLTAIWRRSRGLGVAFSILIVLQAAATVLYFNIPANFFRSFDRHYLPIFVTLGAAAAAGGGVALRGLAVPAFSRLRALAVSATVLITLVPLAQLCTNWSRQNASRRYFARDYAINALAGLPRDAIYFTIGDNDTFPVWYMQAVEGVRRDVKLVNLSLSNAPWYVDSILRSDPAFPLSMSSAEHAAIASRGWPDSAEIVAVRGAPEDFELPAEFVLPNEIALRAGSDNRMPMLPSDALLLDLIRTNAWHRPIAFASTLGRGLGWYADYSRAEGLYSRVIPAAEVPASREILRRNLLNIYRYRSYADPSVVVDDATRGIGYGYIESFMKLLAAEREAGNPDGCRTIATRLVELVPPERIGVPSSSADIVEWCGG
jgi:hypothetical protein